MRVHRGSLFWGIFFLLLGGIPLADREGVGGVALLTDIGRLWPLAIIAIGVVVLASRTKFAVAGTVVAAVVLGGLAGGAVATSGGFVFNVGDCGLGNRSDMRTLSRSGTLDGGGALEVSFSCGTLDLATGAGDGWKLDASYRGVDPTIETQAGRLAFATPRDASRRHEWIVVVPRERIGLVDVSINAGTGKLDVSGSKLSVLSVDGNAGDLMLLADETSINKFSVSINAGRARVNLGGPVVGGVVSVNAGSIDLCVPANADLRITVHEQLTFATNLSQSGLTRSGDVWLRAGSGGPEIRLDVSGNAGSFTLDPTGGCR